MRTLDAAQKVTMKNTPDHGPGSAAKIPVGHEDATLMVPGDVLESWQDIADLIAQLVGVPAALIMRYTPPDVEVLIASRNADNPYQPGERERLDGAGLYCETVIKTRNTLHVADAVRDETWNANPDLALGMVAYLGFPISLPTGTPFGTICLLDRKRNDFSPLVQQLMLKCRDMIESHLELVYMNHVLGERNRRLSDYLVEIQALRGVVTICSHCKAVQDTGGGWQSIERYLGKLADVHFSHGLCPVCLKKLYPDISEDI